MMSQPFADVIQNVVECVRFQCHGAAEIDVFRAESHRNQRENEHRVVRDLPVQRFLDPSRCSLCNDLVRAKRTLVSMLLNAPTGIMTTVSSLSTCSISSLVSSL